MKKIIERAHDGLLVCDLSYISLVNLSIRRSSQCYLLSQIKPKTIKKIQISPSN